ncbi:MAG: hypothetical protein JWO98_5334 [Frankiales bacterium]|nr:hypothetical protein [Frankiales bacterium]
MSKSNYKENGDKPERFGVLKINTAESAKRVDEAERIDLIEIDDVVYSVPNVPRAEVALEYLRLTEEEGTDKAQWYLLREGLGSDAIKALAAVKGLDEDLWHTLVERVVKIIMPKNKRKKLKGKA